MNDETNDRNRQLHELLGRCEHKWKPQNRGYLFSRYRCEKCGESGDIKLPLPDYCSPNSARKLLDEVEAEVVAKYGVAKYGYHLTFIVGAQYTSSANEVAGLAATATAEQRVTAMIEVLADKK